MGCDAALARLQEHHLVVIVRRLALKHTVQAAEVQTAAGSVGADGAILAPDYLEARQYARIDPCAEQMSTVLRTATP